MPVMAVFRSPRVNQNLYDAIMRELDFEHQPPVGALTHSCGFDDKGICVVDVWESRADFEAFVTDRLKPVFAKLGIEFVVPDIVDAHAFRATEDVDRYMRERGPEFRARSKAADREDRPSGRAH